MNTHRLREGFLLWLTGLPSSGKSTLANYLRKNLEHRGIQVQVLDSDEVRSWLTPDPEFTPEERDWFYQALVEIAGLLTDNGVNVIIAATGFREAYRLAARERTARCAIAYIECPRAVCRARDTKGLWDQADRGEISNFPGVDTPYEVPADPEVHVDTGEHNIPEAALKLLSYLHRADYL
jgi:adenylylsulfate kinase